MKQISYQSLHCHTTTSDGVLTHKQVLDECERNNIGVVAFTDHDTLPTQETIEGLKKINHEVKFFTGIEMSATRVIEIKDQIELFHVVGLFVDLENKNLLKYSDNAIQKRIKRTKEIITNCKSLGLDISYDEVQKQVTGTVGRPHIAKAILSKEKNIKIMSQLEKKLFQEAKKNDELKETYEKVKNADLWQKVFTLFLSNNSYIKNVYVHYVDQIYMDDAVSLIRNAGGIALIAHWTYFKDKLPLTLVEKFCQEKRIDGLETVYALGVEEFNQNEFEADMKNLDHLCDKYNLAKGGGGDFHKKEDFKLINNPRFSGFASRTKGLIERVLKLYPYLSKRWSTL